MIPEVVFQEVFAGYQGKHVIGRKGIIESRGNRSVVDAATIHTDLDTSSRFNEMGRQRG